MGAAARALADEPISSVPDRSWGLAIGAGPAVSVGLGGQGNAIGGEASLWAVARRWRGGVGVDAAWTTRGLYTELQLAGQLVGGHDGGVVGGLGAGPTHDGDAADHAWGVQGTAWAFVVVEFPIPLVPFVRIERFPNRQTALSAGLMLKLLVPVMRFGAPGR